MAHRHPLLHIHVPTAINMSISSRKGSTARSGLEHFRTPITSQSALARSMGRSWRALHTSRRTVHPGRRMRSSCRRRSCREPKHGNSSTATGSSRFSAGQVQGRQRRGTRRCLGGGVGIAWLRDWILHDYVASGALVPIMTDYPPPAAHVCGPAARPASCAKIRIVADPLIKYFERNPGSLGKTPPRTLRRIRFADVCDGR
jgi:hypothetical protein